LSHSSEKRLFKVIGRPKKEKLARRDGKPLRTGLPTELVKAASWEEWIEEDDEDIRIIDLGETFCQT
jgi:serine/threonine-protein kinase SRPK3